MSTYIVEKRNGNSHILKMNSDTTYETIGYASGDHHLSHIIDLVKAANSSVDVTAEFVDQSNKDKLIEIINKLRKDKVQPYSIMAYLENIISNWDNK